MENIIPNNRLINCFKNFHEFSINRKQFNDETLEKDKKSSMEGYSLEIAKKIAEAVSEIAVKVERH